tara:strand:- start:74 stop:454 length:381 start_codon:yes stop_codon:yes gene_type:complete
MDKKYIDTLENNLSTINKSAEILLNDLDNLNKTLSNIDKYNKQGFKLNNIIKEIEEHIINTERFLIELLNDTKKRSTNINNEVIKISDNNNIFLNIDDVKKSNENKNKNESDDESDDDNICCCIKL